MSGHGKKLTNRGALTNWRQQREGLVRTRKATNQPRHTHFLETAEGGTFQDMKKKLTNQGKGTLTSWRQQREGLVRTWKETDRQRRTHTLETAEGGTCQDTESNQPTEAHSLPRDGRGRDVSGHGKKPTNQGKGTLTSWRQQREELVRTWKEAD